MCVENALKVGALKLVETSADLGFSLSETAHNSTSNEGAAKSHPPPVEETTLNQTHDSVLGHTPETSMVKRSPR